MAMAKYIQVRLYSYLSPFFLPATKLQIFYILYIFLNK